ncbi:MAG TPA: asparaginase [Actinomycetota bacterium]|nr:asparaginase [Actinomycetota bacterium]
MGAGSAWGGRGEPIAEVTRSGLVESVHLGHVAVCDAAGRLLARVGDPGRVVFARSAMKPLQAAVALRAAGQGLPEAEVAVACASHNGEPVHVRTVRRLLRRAGLPTAALRCPPGWPIDREAAIRAGRPARVLHNCSGKHAAMLLACARRGWDPDGYPRADHPLQRRIHRAVLRAAGLDRVVVGVDGCGVPVHGMPLASLGVLFARLARPDRLGPLAEGAARALAAMASHPYLVAGRNRVDTALMEVAPRVVVKAGAEGLLCAALLEPGIGVAVKVEDGGDRAAAPALLRTLGLLGALTTEQLRALGAHADRPVRGGDGVVGRISSRLDLRPGGE